jgi:hypothetical protein
MSAPSHRNFIQRFGKSKFTGRGSRVWPQSAPVINLNFSIDGFPPSPATEILHKSGFPTAPGASRRSNGSNALTSEIHVLASPIARPFRDGSQRKHDEGDSGRGLPLEFSKRPRFSEQGIPLSTKSRADPCALSASKSHRVQEDPIIIPSTISNSRAPQLEPFGESVTDAPDRANKPKARLPQKPMTETPKQLSSRLVISESAGGPGSMRRNRHVKEVDQSLPVRPSAMPVAELPKRPPSNQADRDAVACQTSARQDTHTRERAQTSRVSDITPVLLPDTSPQSRPQKPRGPLEVRPPSEVIPLASQPTPPCLDTQTSSPSLPTSDVPTTLISAKTLSNRASASAKRALPYNPRLSGPNKHVFKLPFGSSAVLIAAKPRSSKDLPRALLVPSTSDDEVLQAPPPRPTGIRFQKESRKPLKKPLAKEERRPDAPPVVRLILPLTESSTKPAHPALGSGVTSRWPTHTSRNSSKHNGNSKQCGDNSDSTSIFASPPAGVQHLPPQTPHNIGSNLVSRVFQPQSRPSLESPELSPRGQNRPFFQASASSERNRYFLQASSSSSSATLTHEDVNTIDHESTRSFLVYSPTVSQKPVTSEELECTVLQPVHAICTRDATPLFIPESQESDNLAMSYPSQSCTTPPVNVELVTPSIGARVPYMGASKVKLEDTEGNNAIPGTQTADEILRTGEPEQFNPGGSLANSDDLVKQEGNDSPVMEWHDEGIGRTTPTQDVLMAHEFTPVVKGEDINLEESVPVLKTRGTVYCQAPPDLPPKYSEMRQYWAYSEADRISELGLKVEVIRMRWGPFYAEYAVSLVTETMDLRLIGVYGFQWRFGA